MENEGDSTKIIILGLPNITAGTVPEKKIIAV